ncbi:hypothetical protein V5T82_07330 [Magnetovibrio sp. PR-2]|uniref:hypothetical protein n=1 Tax=Magnetovibrio sp. PR-2 TaxID=3120356 RepID=UPI002FCE1639
MANIFKAGTTFYLKMTREEIVLMAETIAHLIDHFHGDNHKTGALSRYTRRLVLKEGDLYLSQFKDNICKYFEMATDMVGDSRDLNEIISTSHRTYDDIRKIDTDRIFRTAFDRVGVDLDQVVEDGELSVKEYMAKYRDQKQKPARTELKYTVEDIRGMFKKPEPKPEPKPTRFSRIRLSSLKKPKSWRSMDELDARIEADLPDRECDFYPVLN